MTFPTNDLEARVVEGLAVPRAVGDLLFLFAALKDAGRSRVELAIDRLAEAGLVRRTSGRLWELTEAGSGWLIDQAEWQVRVDDVLIESGRPAMKGTVDRGIVKPGDWFHNGVGGTGRVADVDSFDSETRSMSFTFESETGLSAGSVLRRWSPHAADGTAFAPPAWGAGLFDADLVADGSLPDIASRFAPGLSWNDIHAALVRTGLRWECWQGDEPISELLSAAAIFAGNDGERFSLKVWVGPVQFNAYYWSPDEVDFDVEIAVLDEPGRFECLVAFMDWVASVAGAEAKLTHEGAPEALIRTSAPSEAAQRLAVWDRLRIADLRNPAFASYRGVVAPGRRLHATNIDAWLERHSDADAVTAVLCHVHLWDEIESTSDEVVLGKLALTIAEHWRRSLTHQFPDQVFEVGVAGEPDEYGPTVWARPLPTMTTRGIVRHLDPSLHRRLASMTALRRISGFIAADAVALAADLVAGGIDDPAVLELAIQPADPNQLHNEDVEKLFDECCTALGLSMPQRPAAGWQLARDLATMILSGDISPIEGASKLWPLWEECGTVPGSDPLDMLQLSDEWEGSVGDERRRTDERIVASAHSVIIDADRALAALTFPVPKAEGVIQARDVMPLLLVAAPSFLGTWYEIEDDHLAIDNPAGRLHYLDAGMFARHVVMMHRSNHRAWLQNAFAVIERMHIEGDSYVRELATIGYLEGIQNVAGHEGIDPEVFVSYLGVESLRWWRGLHQFWAGEQRLVGPD